MEETTLKAWEAEIKEAEGKLPAVLQAISGLLNSQNYTGNQLSICILLEQQIQSFTKTCTGRIIANLIAEGSSASTAEKKARKMVENIRITMHQQLLGNK